MISSIQGAFENCTPTELCIEAAGVGYQIQISLYTYEKIKNLSKGKLRIYYHVSDKAPVLYGFWDMEERTLFLQLITVSGLGPSMARAVLSTYTVKEFSSLINQKDVAGIQQVKGVGKKTAQRIVLELTGKISVDTTESHISSSLTKEALQALTQLGVSKAEAEKNISKILKERGERCSVEELVKLCLSISK